MARLFPARAVLVALASGGLLARAASAPAAEGPPARVRVEVVGCSDELAPARLGDALTVELRNLDPDLVAYIETTNPEVSIRCRPKANTSEIVVRVTTERGEALDETLESAEVGAARFIAIAIAESLYAQASAPRDAPPPPPPEPESKPEPEQPAPTPPAPPPPAHLYPAWWGRVAIGTRRFGEPGLPSLSGRIGVERISSPDWLLAADLEGSHGHSRVDSGELFASTGSMGLALHRRLGRGRFALLPGVGVRTGLLRWSGDPGNRATTRGRAGYGPWAGPFMDLRFALDVTAATRVDLDLEGGFNPLQVKATENSNVIGSIGELWLSLQLGVAFKP